MPTPTCRSPGLLFSGKAPTLLDSETKNALWRWERRKKLDGWWRDQEIMAWKIVEWRDQGLINPEDSDHKRANWLRL